MLPRILRTNTKILQATSTRGGGGTWPRPDTPIIVNNPTKRRWSLFENGLWLADGAQPEFAFTNQEEWFTRYGGIGRQALFGIVAALSVATAFGFLVKTLMPQVQMPTNGIGWEEQPQHQLNNYLLEAKPANAKCFFDSGIKANTGTFRIIYDEHYLQGSQCKWLQDCKDKSQVIQECRDWVGKEKKAAMDIAIKKLEGGHVAHH